VQQDQLVQQAPPVRQAPRVPPVPLDLVVVTRALPMQVVMAVWLPG
jgi:hypothetical protein